MVFFVVAVSVLLCLQSVDYASGQLDQACLNAQQALATNSACQQAFLDFNPTTNTGNNGPLCSGTCRSLLESVRDNCASQAESIRLLLNIACMVTDGTALPTLPNTPACTDATLALGTSTQCTQALASINSPNGADAVCSEACRGLLLNFFQNCPNQYFEQDEAVQGLNLLCGGTTGTPTQGTDPPTFSPSPTPGPGTTRTDGVPSTPPPQIVDCPTALQQFRQSTECAITNVEDVTPESAVCTSECRMLAYNLADACQEVYVTREEIDGVVRACSSAFTIGGLGLFSLLLTAAAVALL